MDEKIIGDCVEHAEQAAQYGGMHEVVLAVLDTLIRLTPSPRTVDELTRIRGDE